MSKVNYYWWFVKDFKQFMAEVIANGDDCDRVQFDPNTMLFTLEKEAEEGTEKAKPTPFNYAHVCPGDPRCPE
jgi:hypothetical protein